MNRELEELVKAYDAWREADGDEARHRKAIFDALLDESSEQRRELSRSTLVKLIHFAHRQWALKENRKPPFIPPKA